jgi:glycosyltransferase involved in cell wall biosynthesis
MSLRLFMTTDAVGGVWRYALTLAAELARADVEVRLGVIGPPAARDQRAEAAARGIGLEQVDAALDWVAEGAATLRVGAGAIAAAARAWGADLLQVNQPAYAGARYPMPVVAVAHSCVETWWRGTHGAPAPSEWAWHRDAVGAGLRAAAVAAAPSRSFAAMLAEVYGLERQPLPVLNGIRPGGAPGGPKGACVLASGRVWDSSKNFPLLDAAAPAIRWPVRLAGECAGPDGVTGLPLRNLRCLGHLGRRAMAEEYAAAPIYVSPSLHEPFGLGVLEAADAGAALVLSDIPAFRELWDGAALFFAPRDAAALAGAANRLIDDPALRGRMARAARDRAARYAVADTARGMRAAYRAAAAMAGAAA